MMGSQGILTSGVLRGFTVLWSPCCWPIALTGLTSWESRSRGHPWLVPEMTDVEIAAA